MQVLLRKKRRRKTEVLRSETSEWIVNDFFDILKSEMSQ